MICCCGCDEYVRGMVIILSGQENSFTVLVIWYTCDYSHVTGPSYGHDVIFADGNLALFASINHAARHCREHMNC